jgi:arginine-tRNA-protein transferase
MSRDRSSNPAPLPSEKDTDPDAEDVSLFDIGMPGVLTLEQVKELDLDHWLLFFNNDFVHMNVCIPSPVNPMKQKRALLTLIRIWSNGKACQ